MAWFTLEKGWWWVWPT